eukprot:gnl/MRDRNA2_/MRDRNA2_291310_c0_seq1.p1 gnl/MRDRNA2_/MRDRNA2_291310_c0~~gnl/MRDRNA2_/MRDRNA2_291310_c0_seq1.p1  ORF type:complete len:202 (+),score=42.16 gnl/MRDRNA2_/MRDRNA2_291310_c0_seq1:23-607(+)
MKVASSLTIKQYFPEGTTGESLLENKDYVDSVETGIAAGFGDRYDVAVVGLSLGPQRLRRLSGSTEMTVHVDYEIEVKDSAAAEIVVTTLADPTAREAFTSSFVDVYTAAEVRKGRTVEGVVATQSAQIIVTSSEARSTTGLPAAGDPLTSETSKTAPPSISTSRTPYNPDASRCMKSSEVGSLLLLLGFTLSA